MVDGGQIFIEAFVKALKKRRSPTSDPHERARRQRSYTAKYLAKPDVQARAIERRKKQYQDKARAAGKAPRRNGRDPEKVKANKVAWASRHPEEWAAIQKAASVRRWKKGRTQDQREAKRLGDLARARSRGRRSKFANAHAHVDAFLQWTRAQSAHLHDAHVKEFFSDPRRKYTWRYRFNAEFRLKELVRNQVRKKVDSKDRVSELIRSALRRAGESGTIVNMLGWSIAELRQHLESQLPAGETLLSLGKMGYHIDHIIPKRYFDLSTQEGVRAYWALENLRPLPAAENLRKGARLEVDHVI